MVSLILIRLYYIFFSCCNRVRTTAIKFVEMIIISLSPRIKESMIPSINEWDISLDQISDDHPILNKTALQEEGRICLRKLLDYTLSTHISSVNLISSVCVLSSIAKQRPEFMEIVLETYKNILGKIEFRIRKKT